MRVTEEGSKYLRSRAPDLEHTSLGETILAAVIVKREISEEQLVSLFRPVPEDQIIDAVSVLTEAGFLWQ